jgi:polyketide synthase PksJ/polyketide synthase PksN
VRVQCVVSPEDEAGGLSSLSGLSGILRTAAQENPRVRGQVVGLSRSAGVSAWVSRLAEDAATDAAVVRYVADAREVETVTSFAPVAAPMPWKAEGVYLLTGGLGGVGRWFAAEIVRRAPGARVVLAGRSQPDAAQRSLLSAWASTGAQVEYVVVDVGDAASVEALVSGIWDRHGRLDGVLHAAGVVRDGFLVKKTASEYAAVMAGKVRGALHLDAAIGDRPLDFFVVFSSTTAVYGNVGQADYAAANGFLDGFAQWRSERVERGARHGVSVSIGWPLWAEGGMQVPEALARQLRARGLVPLPTEAGVEALSQALASGRSRVHLHRVVPVAEAAPEVRADVVPMPGPEAVAPAVTGRAPAGSGGSFEAQVQGYLMRALSGTLRLPVERIEADAPFEHYGLDSILALELTSALERIFGPLSKTLFFEYQTLSALSRHFAQAHRGRLEQLLAEGGVGSPAPRSVPASAPVPARVAPVSSGGRGRGRAEGAAAAAAARSEREAQAAGRAPIAIVGMSGRYPGAETLEAFWANLAAGRDSITEVPAERWDHGRYYDAQKGALGKTYGKWGGFMAGVEAFDPLFFNISPAEARVLDPQERLFLQCAYETLEDAGYTRASLGRGSRSGRAGDVGVFVGVMYEDYQLYGAQAQALGLGIALSGSPASIANRVSYFCDFHGPSLAVDTMCSSSLTAIHLACESLSRGECDAALAGGVNVTVHPNKYLVLGQGRFLSSDGRCRSFGADGDGYVPGEGVGAVLLKRLSDAEADGDRVLGVILGSVVNHGGKTNGYSVPNPVAQASLIERALADAGVAARTISYVEAHGTGTSLGDPIEMSGLAKAFGAQTAEVGFCAIGSVKSNIGHCESAAGIAALTKVLLQMRHGQLAPSLHAEPANPYIDFEGSPFVVQRTLGEWVRPVDAAGVVWPRRAGISSFGAGGSNAHLIVEAVEAPAAVEAVDGPQAIVLSAKTEEALQRQVQRLLTYVETHAASLALVDIAHTLQVGREALDYRLGLVAGSVEDLVQRLRACAAGAWEEAGAQRGEVRRNREMLSAFAQDEALQAAVETWLSRGRHETLVEFWAKGLSVDWTRLAPSGGRAGRRIGLPTYPFAQERYWIGAREIGLEGGAATLEVTQPAERWLRRQWVTADAPVAERSWEAGAPVAILATASTRGLAQALAARWTDARIVVPGEGEASLSDCAVLIDVGGCADEAARDEAEDPAWIEALQAWVSARSGTGGVALCVTCGQWTERAPVGGALRAGLYRMLTAEYGRIRSHHVDVEHGADGVWIEQCLAELEEETAVEVRYRSGRRERTQLVAEPPGSGSEVAWSPEAVLWVTGGTRGIGLACARHFVARHGVKRLVLGGRESLPPASEWAQHAQRTDAVGAKVRALQALEAQGVQVYVSSVALEDASAVASEVETVRRTLGPIGGLLHCAGVTDASTPALIRKSRETIAAVLSPKVSGVSSLLSALGSEPLRFCVLFSSISGLSPALAAGQADYAMANAAMDAAALGAEASGLPVVSVQWGSWNESGMGEVRSRVYRELGLLSHSDAEGLSWLDRIVGEGLRGVVAPLRVDTLRFEAGRLLQRRAPAQRAVPSGLPVLPAAASAPVVAGPAGGPAGAGDLLAQVQQWLRGLFSQQLQLAPEKLALDTPLAEYGADSVLLMQVLVPINARVGQTLDPSMLYEHPTIEAFSRWLVGEYGEALSGAMAAEAESAQRSEAPAVPAPVPVAPAPAPMAAEAPAARPSLPETAPVAVSVDEPLAIVGMACRFAGAPDLEGYWDLLSRGASAIAPVPASRWGEASGDWAGLLEEVDLFDPQFFHLSPADAQAMDPQARLVLEESLKALHHAGYAVSEMKGTRTGVYLGARGQYHGDSERLRHAPNPIMAVGQNYLAANVSHFFDLRGPSLVVDTACSSALVALNMAGQALRSGEIGAALVGGVSVLGGPEALRMFERRGILQRGEYHIFDRRAQGAILGEGVGMVVVKTQSQARVDGDRVYGLIRAVAVNNDGRTAGPTAPNVHAQKDVMRQALSRSGCRAEEIGHIDVNGSGSEVTDLLELRAIESVYRPQGGAPCELGSMKPNIGHPLCAEGIASLIKVVLMLERGQRVPFLSAQEPMAHYDLERSPFRFTRTLRAWGEGRRLGAVNSFADGGTNAHVIVEAVPAEATSRRSPRPLPPLQRVSMGGPGGEQSPAMQDAAQQHPRPASPAASEVVAEGAWE